MKKGTFGRMGLHLFNRGSLDRRRIELHVLGICVAFLFWLGVTFAPSFWGIDEEPLHWWRWLKSGPVDLRGSALFSVGLLLLFLLPRWWQFMRRWAAWRKPIFLDVVLASFAAFQVVTALLDDPGSSWRAWLLAGGTLSLILLRLALRHERREDGKTPLFDQTLGPSGFSPLHDFSEDLLERGPLLDSLCQLVAYKRQPSINFGVEGAWGSGKTTLLRGLEQRLIAAKHIVVRFDTWSYREPDRLVRSYFDALEASLSKTIAVPGLRRRLYKLASGLTELGEGRLTTIVGSFLKGLSGASEDDLREEIGRTLNELDRPVVLLVDDLDRLDDDELKAVLRAIKLVGELPNLTHVLAYDRAQISQTLFPEDVNGTRARDYLGKLVNVEFSIGTPPVDLAAKLLDSGLRPLLDEIGEEAAKQFVADLQSQPLSKLLEALPTPREARRVAATTAWHWKQMERRVNPFDVFILSVIQYRFPSLYGTMRSHPEWFTVAEWSSDPWRLGYKEEWERKSKEFFKSLSAREDPESQTKFNLLKLLLPGVAASGIMNPRPSEDEARKNRRLLHPDNYHRYFNLYIPASVITEAEMEDFAAAILSASAGPHRQNMLRGRIEQEVARGRIESFWDQWDIGFRRRSPTEASLAEDLALGIAAASDKLSTSWSFFQTSSLDRAIWRVANIVSLVRTDEEATHIMEAVIRKSALDYVPGYLIRAARDKQERQGIFQERRPDLDRLESAFGHRISERHARVGSVLLSARNERVAVLWSSDTNLIEELFTRDLQDSPILLPRLLEIACPITSEQRLVVENLDLPFLASKLSFERLHALTDQVPLDAWTDPIDRKLVKRFRAWDPSTTSPSRHDASERSNPESQANEGDEGHDEEP